MFGYPVRLRTSRRSGWEQDGPKDVNESEQRSWPGAILTIIFIILVLGKLAVEIQDLILAPTLFEASQYTLPLEYLEDGADFNINNHSFLPSIDVRLMAEAFGEAESKKAPESPKEPERKWAFDGKYYEETGMCISPPGAPEGNGKKVTGDTSALTNEACEKLCTSDLKCKAFYVTSKKCIKFHWDKVIGNGMKNDDPSITMECYIKGNKPKSSSSPSKEGSSMPKLDLGAN